jgi:hypothetical protein
MSSQLIELERKIIAGLKKASDNLVKTSAANNESLVISINGEIRHVPAKELLQNANSAK